MGDNEVYITTTKQSSSMRQILAAIDHLHKQEFEAAIKLAAAAEGQSRGSHKASVSHYAAEAPEG
jgi:hypothetical protein